MSYIRNYVDVHVSTNNTGSKTIVFNELFKRHQTTGYYVKWFTINNLIVLGILGLLVITVLAIIDFEIQKKIHQDRLIKKGAIYLGLTSLCIFFILLGSYLGGHISISQAVTTLLAVLSFDSGVFAYLYNNWNSNQATKLENAIKMKLQLHSEAGWRPKLYELMKKEKPVYRDVLYFTSFFNIGKKADKVDLDVKIRYALEKMVNAPENVESILNCLYQKGELNVSDDNKPFVALLAKKKLDNQLNDNQEVIFKSCISLLLRNDWEEQKKGIEKLEKGINEVGQTKK